MDGLGDVVPEAQCAVRFRSEELFGAAREPHFWVFVDLLESYLEEPA
jgi:hypothetical protein